MILISSSCVNEYLIKNVIMRLHNEGFSNIELSGGTNYYDGICEDIIALKEQLKCNFILHNYFPPPKKEFVLNLASLDTEIFDMTIDHYLKAIDLSKKISSNCFGIHAGFLIDIHTGEIGKTLSRKNLSDRDKAMETFVKGYKILQKEAEDITLYIENNVLSCENKKKFKENPFLLTNADEYFEIKKEINFPLLLDIAHLKVSSQSQGIDFYQEFKILSKESDYWHVSGNNGLLDQNASVSSDKTIINLIEKQTVFPELLTIEVYDSLPVIKKDVEFFETITEVIR